MVSGTGVKKDSLRLPPPFEGETVREKSAACAFADEIGRYAEVRHFDLRKSTAIELQEPAIRSLIGQRKDVYRRVPNNRAQFLIRYAQADEPQPWLTDLAKQPPILVQLRLIREANRKSRVVSDRDCRRRSHFQVGHNIGDLAGRHVGVAVLHTQEVYRRREGGRQSCLPR